MTEKDYEDQIEEGAVFELESGTRFTIESVEDGWVSVGGEDLDLPIKEMVYHLETGWIEPVADETPNVDQMMEELREEWGGVYCAHYAGFCTIHDQKDRYGDGCQNKSKGDTFTEALEAAYRENIQGGGPGGE